MRFFKEIFWNLRQTEMVVPAQEPVLAEVPLPCPSPTLACFLHICGVTELWFMEFDWKEKPQSNLPAGHQLQPN